MAKVKVLAWAREQAVPRTYSSWAEWRTVMLHGIVADCIDQSATMVEQHDAMGYTSYTEGLKTIPHAGIVASTADSVSASLEANLIDRNAVDFPTLCESLVDRAVAYLEKHGYTVEYDNE